MELVLKKNTIKKITLISFLVLLSLVSNAQTTDLQGQIFSKRGKVIPYLTVHIKGKKADQCDEKGKFTIPNVSYGVNYILHITQFGQPYKDISVHLKKGESNFIKIKLDKKATKISEVDVVIQKEKELRKEASITKIDPRSAKMMTSMFGDFNKSISSLAGVNSSNELSSTYSVRGGNYDENLVYVEGMQIYRPFLISTGQQEGLSFVNPDLVSDIEFSAGGWQPKYGDKLSSVLSIQYKKPTKFGGSLTAGRLGGSLHLENISKNEKLTYIVGVRYKDARAALNRLQTEAEYKPKFLDVQSYITYDLTNKKKYPNQSRRATLEGLFSYANNDYYIEPETKTTTFGAITSSVKRLTVAYDGYESLQYKTYQGGLKFKQRFNEKISTEVIVSQLSTVEREFFDVEAGYQLCDIKVDFSDEENLDKCFLEQDIGTEYKYARNTLNANVTNVENKWNYVWSEKSTFKWGVRYGNENIKDTISEYEFIDSADFVNVTRLLRSQITLNSNRYNGFAQHTVNFDSSLSMTYGVRASYWGLNKRFTVSPRLQFSYKPKWKRDFMFKLASGIYHQSPFYREMRNNEGEINKDITAQRSIHLILASDYKFKMWGRGFKFVGEAYYKNIQNVIPYEYNDVKIRYQANNNAQAYATGADFRLSGDFIKDAESWFSLGFLQTKEKLDNAFYTQNDGTIAKAGFVPRPTDQLVTFGVFFQDHLPNNPTVKMYLSMNFGSGLPFSAPNSTKYKYTDSTGTHQSYGRIQSYRRVDIGFSKLILFREDGSKKTKLKSLWLGVEILNIIGATNTVSVSWIKDTYNTVYGIPNYLSARLLNVKMIAKF